MKYFMSFIGSNDAGELAGFADKGAILTILDEYKFDKICLLYNPDGKVKDKNTTYQDIANYLRNKIITNKYCNQDDIKIDKFDIEDVADYTKVFPKLLKYLEESYRNLDFSKDKLFVGISSGTPAMQIAWVLIYETNLFNINILRSVEKKFARNKKRVIEPSPLAGMREKLNELEKYKTKVKVPKLNYNKIYDNKVLTKEQENIAKTDNPILIYGESGSGKEILFDTIHNASGREQQIALNCAGYPEQLLESELFGYKKGAFTGAIKDKIGIVEEYKNGTLFLDEVNSLPMQVQGKLLRFIDTGEFRMLGSNQVKNSKIRIVSATNQPLHQLVHEGKFREDLYFRLRTFEFQIIPLREKPEIISDLVKKISDLDFSPEAMEILKQHHFKGNIRELKLILDRLQIVSKNRQVIPENLKAVISQLTPPLIPEAIEIPKELYGKAYKTLRSLLAKAVLEKTGGNASAASKIMGTNHVTPPKWSKEI